MEVGELRIQGSIDTLNIEKGINGIILDLQKVDQKSQSVNSDFERMYQNTNKLATALGMIGASTALLELAKEAPQVAPALASMQLSMLQLSFAVGQALAPAFDWFAGQLNKLVQWANANPDLFKGLVEVIGGLGIVAAGLTLGAGIVTLFGWLMNPAVLLVGLALWDVYSAFKAITDLAKGGSGNAGRDWGSLIGGVIGAVGGVAGAIMLAPETLGASLLGIGIAGTAGYAGGSAIGGKVGGLFDKKTTSTNQQTATNSGNSSYMNDWWQQTTQNQSRRNVTLNMSSFNIGY